MPSGEKIKNPSKIIHLQGHLVKHFYFPSVLFPAIPTSRVLKEVRVTYVMEKNCRNGYTSFFHFFVRPPLHTHKGIYRCLPMLHGIYKYINNAFKIWVDDLRRTKIKHKAGKKLQGKNSSALMLLWCWRGLLVISGILHIIKFENVLSISVLSVFADNIKAWWKDCVSKNLTNIALWALQILIFTGENVLGFFPSGSGNKIL